MNTLTAQTPSTSLPSAGWLTTMLRTLTAGRGTTAADPVRASAAALLERADAYAETQPSYAADLRAAAAHVLGDAA